MVRRSSRNEPHDSPDASLALGGRFWPLSCGERAPPMHDDCPQVAQADRPKADYICELRLAPRVL
jgi:hypothetical protein